MCGCAWRVTQVRDIKRLPRHKRVIVVILHTTISGKCARSFVTSRGVNIKSDKHFHRNSRKLVVAVHYIKEEDMLVNI